MALPTCGRALDVPAARRLVRVSIRSRWLPTWSGAENAGQSPGGVIVHGLAAGAVAYAVRTEQSHDRGRFYPSNGNPLESRLPPDREMAD